MLKAKKQRKYFDKRCKALSRHLQFFIKNGNLEELHQLRVETKKIRALFYLSEHCLNDFKPLSELKQIKKIFKHAGIIRNAQVSLQLVKDYGYENKYFLTRQRKIINNQSDKFLAKANKYVKEIKKARSSQKYFLDIKNECVLKLYKKELSNLNKTFLLSEMETKLHKCRKKIKTLLYIHKILDEPLIKKLKVNFFYLRRLQDKINGWHDSMVAMALLRKIKNPTEKVIAFVTSHEQKLLKEINSLSHNFSGKVILK